MPNMNRWLNYWKQKQKRIRVLVNQRSESIWIWFWFYRVTAVSSIAVPTTKTLSEETIVPPQTVSLPADFFDNRLEGVLATGIKQKDAAKQLKEYSAPDLF